MRNWADITPVRLCHGQRPQKDEKEAKSDKTVDDNKVLNVVFLLIAKLFLLVLTI